MKKIMETISRKSLLYKSGIGVFCINPVQGCSHGCRYPCYAYMIAKSYNRTASYEEWCTPKLVANAAGMLKKELARKKTQPDTIHLCLSTDPFMTGYPEVIAQSLELIAIINSFGIRCSILTKGKLPAELADPTRFLANNLYGISLISLNEAFRLQWEPGTTPYAERIAALKHLHDSGLQTRVHIEPYPTPNLIQQDLNEILETVGFVDQLYFGGWNYNNIIKQYPNPAQFYSEQAAIAQRFCRERGIDFHA